MYQAVDPMDGIRYGLGLLGYVFVVALVGGLLWVVGFAVGGPTGGFRRPHPLVQLVGWLFVLLGTAVVYAGILGTGYKVVADAVALGNATADGPRSVAESTPAGGTSTAGQRTHGPGGRRPSGGSQRTAERASDRGAGRSDGTRGTGQVDGGRGAGQTGADRRGSSGGQTSGTDGGEHDGSGA